MDAAPDQADLAPSRDPAVYGRTRLLSPAFWAMMGFAVLCILAGVAVVTVVPRWTAALAAHPSASALRANAPAAAPEGTAPPPTVPAPGPVAVGGPDLAGVQSRLAALETGQARTARAAARALAAADLSAAAASGRPFAGELDEAERLLPGSPDLALLEAVARTGAPSRAALAAGFADLAAEASVAARRPARGASLLAQARYALARIVDIRRVDLAGEGPDAAIARAERAASVGDLEGAVAALAVLPGAARAPLQPWLDGARARIALDARLAALRRDALAELAAAQGGGA